MKNKIYTIILLFIVTLAASAQEYLEVPSLVSEATYATVTTDVDGQQARSYTYRYDPELRISLWVAYPLNTSLIGKGSRGEGWHPAPELPNNIQPILYKGFAYGSGYDRGHQIPSADRLRPDANEQTFTFVNATPQLHDFNGGIWAELEKLVRTWAKRSDTLYVVTGAVPGNTTIEDNQGNPVNIPSAYYKAVLRRNKDKKGNIHWSAACVYLPHKTVPIETWQFNLRLFRAKSISISELEKKTGEKYFPLLDSIIGAEQAEQIRQTPPRDNPWWWK